MKIVVADSDLQHGKILLQYLVDMCDVHLVAPAEMLSHAEKANPRLFILSVESTNHFKNLIKEVRSHKDFFDCGIICLFNDESRFNELITAGADTVVKHNSELDEVYWAVFSLKRRLTGFVPLGEVQLGPYVVNPHTREVIQEGKRMRVKPVQIKLLSAFHKYPNRLLTREWLKINVWGSEGKVTFRSIDAQISKLKKSLPFLEAVIESIYGEGYMYKPENSEKVS